MKKSFMTNMPDKSGAFLQAAQIILRHGGNITRANYNNTIDIHTLFVDVEAEPEALRAIETELTDAGFLYVSGSPAKIVLLEAEVPDRPGALVPLLEVVNRYQINISYMSTQVSPAAASASGEAEICTRSAASANNVAVSAVIRKGPTVVASISATTARSRL